MALPRSTESGHTYADYLAWSDDQRWELLDGDAVAMSPAPSDRHQQVVGRLHVQFFLALESSPCQVRLAPYDVILDAARASHRRHARTVVQPDLVVVCDPDKLQPHGCDGPPDLVVEVTSPSTQRNDFLRKYLLYDRHGVKEYWIVVPETRRVHVYRREPEAGRDELRLHDVLGPEDVLGERDLLPGEEAEMQGAEGAGEMASAVDSQPGAKGLLLSQAVPGLVVDLGRVFPGEAPL